MKRLRFQIVLLLICLWSGVLAAAAQETARPERLLLRVVVDSAFIHSDPLLSAEATASAFEGDLLEAIGRNADGTWYEVARPYSTTKLGWISNAVVGRPNSDIFALPITSTVGVTGDVPVYDTGYAAFVLGNTSLRSQPGIRAQRLALIPNSVTIPVLARNQDGSALQVNYNGTVGWVASYLVRINVDPMDLPQAEGLSAPPVARVQIPYEVQIAQIERLRSYATEQYQAATDMSNYWELVIAGEVVPCVQYETIGLFPYTDNDIRELPELGRIAPRMNSAVTMLNNSRADIVCGVRALDDVSDARANAINARLILDNTLFQIDSAEDVVSARR
jgi:hypothetical protein